VKEECLSILMPVYNARRYVAEAIRSILTQTFEDFELIIIDDGSTDGSLNILREFAAADDRIVLVSHENRGGCEALNEGLSLARGEFVAPMDHDDISMPNRLAAEVAFLREHEEVVCVSGDYGVIDHAGRFLTVMRREVHDDAELQSGMLRGHLGLVHPGSMYRREPVLAAGGYNPDLWLAHDGDLFLRMGEVGKLANIREVVVHYRLHCGSASGKQFALQWQQVCKACRNAWQRRGIDGEMSPTEEYRPGPERRSRQRFALRYGWWAFRSRERKTAMIYGIKAIWLRPLNFKGWRLLACAALKEPEMPREQST